MTRKVLIMIITLALAALALLAIRQEQINTVNSMSSLHHEIESINSELDFLKIRIEMASSPNTIETPTELVHSNEIQP